MPLTNFRNLLSASLILCFAATVRAQKPEWQQIDVVEVNRAPMRAIGFPFVNEKQAALGREKASNHLLLNGIWKFKWPPKPQDVPTGFELEGLDDRAWDNFPVPANWNLKAMAYPSIPTYLMSLAKKTVKAILCAPPHP